MERKTMAEPSKKVGLSCCAAGLPNAEDGLTQRPSYDMTHQQMEAIIY